MRRVGTATASRGFQCTMFSFISRTPRCGSNAPLPSICNLKHLFVLSRGERDRACPAQIGARVRDKHADAGSSPFSGKDGHGGDDDVQIRPRRHIVSQLQSVIGKRDVPKHPSHVLLRHSHRRCTTPRPTPATTPTPTRRMAPRRLTFSPRPLTPLEHDAQTRAEAVRPRRVRGKRTGSTMGQLARRGPPRRRRLRAAKAEITRRHGDTQTTRRADA